MNSTSIQIGETIIHKSEKGLYSGNDLWKASGKRSAKRPEKWLKLESAKELVDACRNLVTEQNQLVIEVIQGGKPVLQGTFVCKDLAYAYAMWLSPQFYLLVIRTFDAVINSVTLEELQSAKDKANWAMGELIQVEKRHPNHAQSISSIMGLSPYEARHALRYLVQKGEIEAVTVYRQPRVIYRPTQKATTVIGNHGTTLLFSEAVKKLFPVQNDWVGG